MHRCNQQNRNEFKWCWKYTPKSGNFSKMGILSAFGLVAPGFSRCRDTPGKSSGETPLRPPEGGGGSVEVWLTQTNWMVGPRSDSSSFPPKRWGAEGGAEPPWPPPWCGSTAHVDEEDDEVAGGGCSIRAYRHWRCSSSTKLTGWGSTRKEGRNKGQEVTLSRFLIKSKRSSFRLIQTTHLRG